MNARQRRNFTAGRNVDAYLTEKKFTDARVRKLHTQLHEIIGDLQRLDEKQHIATTGAPKPVSQLRRELRRVHLIPITRTGRSLFRNDQEMVDALRVPHASVDVGSLISAAEHVVKVLRPHVKLFWDEGYEKDFLTQLANATKQLKTWSSPTGTKRYARSEAIGQLRGRLIALRRVLTILDGIVPVLVAGDGTQEAKWRAVMRAPKRLGRPRKAKKRASRPKVVDVYAV